MYSEPLGEPADRPAVYTFAWGWAFLVSLLYCSIVVTVVVVVVVVFVVVLGGGVGVAGVGGVGGFSHVVGVVVGGGDGGWWVLPSVAAHHNRTEETWEAADISTAHEILALNRGHLQHPGWLRGCP